MGSFFLVSGKNGLDLNKFVGVEGRLRSEGFDGTHIRKSSIKGRFRSLVRSFLRSSVYSNCLKRRLNFSASTSPVDRNIPVEDHLLVSE